MHRERVRGNPASIILKFRRVSRFALNTALPITHLFTRQSYALRRYMCIPQTSGECHPAMQITPEKQNTAMQCHLTTCSIIPDVQAVREVHIWGRIAMKFLIAPIIFALSVIGVAEAQQIVGRTIVDGETVILYSDKTWTYESPAEQGCTKLDANFSFCPATNQWSSIATGNPQITAAYRYDARTYGMLIAEPLGLNDGVNLTSLAEVVLTQTANLLEIPRNELLILESEDVLVQDVPGLKLSYAVDVNSIPIVYTNTIVVRDSSSIQIMTYETGSQLTERHKEINAEFIDAVQFD